MSSIPSRDDIRFRAYELGIKNPQQLNAFMRLLDRYAFYVAHKLIGLQELPPPVAEVREYLCRGCDKEKPLADFPDSKRRNPSRNSNCTVCQGKNRYKCTGPCGQMKSLDEFPEKKRNNPRTPSPCTICEPKVITHREARAITGHEYMELGKLI